jgi:hypothetical protein
LLEARGFNHLGLAAAVLAGLGRAFLHLGRDNTARHLHRVADRAERVAKVIDVGLRGLVRLGRSDVRDVCGQHVCDGSLARRG